jgi:2-isopropylmalate synthase
MDATRTDPEYLYEIVEATIEAGATTVNIPDTVGYTVPEHFGALIRNILERVSNIDHAVISVHCHDDLGMAVSNTLAALKSGARQAECTLNGLGERAGNAALEEIVMAVRTRNDYFGLHTGVEAREICPTSRLVSRLMGIPVAPNKAIVGANAFAHSSGIHQDGVLKARDNFEIMAPQDVGLESTQIVLTARSGRHALKHRLEKLGHELSQEDLDRTYKRFLNVADKKKEVYDEDLLAIVDDEIRDVPEKYHLEYLHTISGTGTVPSATVRIRIDGKEDVQESAWGDGPVDAAYKAIAQATGTSVEVGEYAIRSITSGAEAMGEVNVRVSQNGTETTGRGASTDIIEASVKAYIDGLNRLAVRMGIEERRAQTV